MSEVAQRLIEHIVLWNGGWDKYLVDLNEVIDAPETACAPKWWEHHMDHTFDKDGKRWLMCRELNHDWYNDKVLTPRPERGVGVHPDSKGVRILRRLGSGD